MNASAPIAVPDYAKPENIVECAKRLAEFGYHPVPIPAGLKGPTLNGWQKLHLTAATVPQYFVPGMLAGILHDNVLALDLDIYDAELAKVIGDEARRRFPTALERIGQSPKSALLFRLEAPGFKIPNTEKLIRVTEDGKELSAQVEVRSVTGQIVVYGKHQDTGRPYVWPRGELWATPRADLPRADRAEIQQFRDWAADQIRKWAGVPDLKVIDTALSSRPRFADERPTEDAFLEALRHVPSSLPYDEWLNGLMGIHDFYGGSLAGLEVAKAWSWDYPGFSPQEVDSKWRSFEVGRGVSYRSMFHLARQNGADLSAMARTQLTAAEIAAPTPPPAATDGDGAPVSPLEWYQDILASLGGSYLIKGVLGAQSLSAIYGPSNSGKTFFALDMVFHIAAGRDWRGRRVVQSAVLYLAAEGGTGVQNRIAALKKHSGVPALPLALRRAGMDLLHKKADLQAVYDLAIETRERSGLPMLLIVIDTLSRAMAGGDENSPADMTALISNIDAIREATGAHVMLVHHTGKDAAKGARGHSSLRAALDTEIEIQVDGVWRSAQVTKQRDYVGGEEFPFILEDVFLGFDQDGDEVSSCVVIAASAEEAAAERPRKFTKNQKVLLEVFDMLAAELVGKLSDGGPLMPPARQFWLVPMVEFRTACEGKFTAKNTRDAFLTAFDAMNEPGNVFSMASGFVWRTDRRRKG